MNTHGSTTSFTQTSRNYLAFMVGVPTVLPTSFSRISFMRSQCVNETYSNSKQSSASCISCRPSITHYSLLFVYYTSTYSIVHRSVLLLLVYFVLLVRVCQDHRDDLPIANKLVIPTTYYTTKLVLIYFDVDETVSTVNESVIRSAVNCW